MSRFFGPAQQVGYVVENLDAALKRWTDIGVGPFFRLDHVPLSYFRVRGQDIHVDLSIALAYSGEMQIELIEQHNPDPSPYTDFLKQYGPGMQHLGMWSSNYDTDIAALKADGHAIAFEGEITNAGRFAYFDAPFEPGTYMEVGDISAETRAAMMHLKQAAAQWDGSDPVRRLMLG